MRIGVDVSIFRMSRAGIARYLDNMLRLMIPASDHEFFLYSPRPVPLDFPGDNWHPRSGSGPRARVGSHWFQSECPRLLASDGIDVFWGQNHMLPLRTVHPIRRVLTIHDLAVLISPRTMPLHSRLLGRLYLPRAARAADCVIAVSAATARLVTSLLGVPADRIRVVSEGVDGRLRPVDREPAARILGERFGLAPGYLLTVGTIEPRKGHLVLLKAIEQAVGLPMLAVVGRPGWKCRGIMRAIRGAERGGAVRFLGGVDDELLPALYGAAKLMVCASHYEGFGLPVLEAMACGCPVLCSWSSSLPEVGGAAAQYFRAGDASDLASRIAALTKDEAALRRMAAAGRRRASRFGFEPAAREVLRLLVGS